MINMVSTLAIARHALRYGVAERDPWTIHHVENQHKKRSSCHLQTCFPTCVRARVCVSSRAVSSYPIYCMYSAVVCKYRVLPKGPLHFNSLWILRHQPSATNKWTSHSRRPDLTQPSQDIKLLAYRLPPASTCQGDRVQTNETPHPPESMILPFTISSCGRVFPTW